jgi:hypothetical protein
MDDYSISVIFFFHDKSTPDQGMPVTLPTVAMGVNSQNLTPTLRDFRIGELNY